MCEYDYGLVDVFTFNSSRPLPVIKLLLVAMINLQRSFQGYLIFPGIFLNDEIKLKIEIKKLNELKPSFKCSENYNFCNWINSLSRSINQESQIAASGAKIHIA